MRGERFLPGLQREGGGSWGLLKDAESPGALSGGAGGEREGEVLQGTDGGNTGKAAQGRAQDQGSDWQSCPGH